MTKSTRVGSHMRGNVYGNMSKTACVNSHMRALLLPYIHSHVNSGRTCEFTCGACGVLWRGCARRGTCWRRFHVPEEDKGSEDEEGDY